MSTGTISGGPINLFTWQSLYPYNYSSNYGGQYQFNVMPSYLTPAQAFGIQNVFNPIYHFSQMMNSINSMFNPTQSMQQMMLNQAAYANGYAIGENIGNNVIAQNLGNNIAGLKAQLEQALTSDNLTSEQKAELRALKREVEALEDRFNELKSLQQCGATPEQIKAGISQLSEEYRELRNRIQAKAEEIQAELESASAAGSADDDTDTEEVSGDSGEEVSDDSGEEVSDDSGEGSGTLSGGLGGLEFAPFNEVNEDIVAADVDDENVREIVSTIYSKVDGIGSGNIKKYLDQNINKDNVVEVMLLWNKYQAPGFEKADPLGFTETLMDERLMTGDRICKVVIESLEERLKDYQGVDVELYNTASAQLAIARHELESWWSNEDKMSEAINKAHKCITILMYAKAGRLETE